MKWPKYTCHAFENDGLDKFRGKNNHGRSSDLSIFLSLPPSTLLTERQMKDHCAKVFFNSLDVVESRAGQIQPSFCDMGDKSRTILV